MAKSQRRCTPEFCPQMVAPHRDARSFDDPAKEFGRSRRKIRQSGTDDDVDFLSHISRMWPRSGSLELPRTNEPDHRKCRNERWRTGGAWGAAS
jgi:hypothetical protein